MRDLAILVIQLIMMIARFFRPGDARLIVTELLLVKVPAAGSESLTGTSAEPSANGSSYCRALCWIHALARLNRLVITLKSSKLLSSHRDHIIVLGPGHLKRVLSQYVGHYKELRSHLSLQ